MKIILDNKEVTEFVPESLPMLIHGSHGNGSSLYTITLATKWFSQGNNILLLCGYPMAKEEFEKQVGTSHENAKFFNPENANKFLETIKNGISENTIVFVKNIELFDEKVFDSVLNIKNLIISGDISKASFKEKILEKKYTTEIYFSHLNKELPEMNKYEGLVISRDYRGITKVSP